MGLWGNSFNRTSLESKLLLDHLRREVIGLLIEPVWNRNMCEVQNRFTAGNLLIEPVWNRNDVAAFDAKVGYLLLLIEPVWNRNSTGRAP